MEPKDFAKQIVEFNQNAAKIGFETIIDFSGQAAKMADSLINVVPNVPDEVKIANTQFFVEQKKALSNLQGYVEGQLNIDWTSQDAPLKSLEVLEQYSKQAYAQADSIKKNSKPLADKATEQLPEEVKPLVNIWNDAINSTVSLFQDSLNKSFELSKELLAKSDGKKKAAAK